MPILQLKKYGDAVLRKKTQPIAEITNEIKQLAFDMLETMYACSGVGLAAPQIGHSLKICVIDVDPNKNTPYILINPTIISGENKILSEEGCLSFPKIFEKINRFETVTAEYTDINGKKKTLTAKGFLAKALQHEIDHLNAKLFIDYLPEWKRKIVEKEIKRRKKVKDW